MHPDDQATATPSRRRWWLLAFVLIALVPVLGAAVRMHSAGWVPEGDDAMIARRTMAVLSTDPPLTGQPSTAGGLFTKDGSTLDASVEASHPGPIAYWTLAVPYRLAGWSPLGLLLGVALVTGAAAATTVWLGWRRLGVPGAAAGCAAVLVVAQQLGSFHLARPLNATIVLLPLLAGLVGTWAVLAGDRIAIVPTVVALSFAVQGTLSVAPLAALALVVSLVAAAWHWWRGPRDRTAWMVLGAVVVLLAGAWALVAIEQFTGDPGNVSRLWKVSRLEVDRAGFAFAASAVLGHVVAASWPTMPVIPRISILGPQSGPAALAKGLVLVVATGLGAAWARHRHRPALGWLLATSLGAVVASTVVLANGPDEVPYGPEYLVTWLIPVSALLGFTIVAFAADALSVPMRRWRPGFAVAPVAIAALGAAAVATAVAGGPIDREDSARTAAISEALRDELPPGTYRLTATGSYAYLSTLDAVSVDLLAHGYDVRVVRLGAIPDEGRVRDTDVDAPTIVLDSTGAPSGDGTVVIATDPLTSDLSWAGDLYAAVGDPSVRLEVVGSIDSDAECVAPIQDLLAEPDGPAARQHLAEAILACDQADRRATMDAVEFVGLDGFWTDQLRSNMPAPYPQTGVVARVVPAGS